MEPAVVPVNEEVWNHKVHEVVATPVEAIAQREEAMRTKNEMNSLQEEEDSEVAKAVVEQEEASKEKMVLM